MYARKRHTYWQYLMLLLGLAGAGLRLLEESFLDLRGLLPAGHPLGIAMVSVAGLAVILALCSARKPEGQGTYETHFPGSLAGALGHLLAAAGALLTVLAGRSGMQGGLGLAWKLLGFASVPCLAAAGWFRLRGKQPVFLLHLCPGVFLMIHTINQYQSWSSEPQILTYLFPLLGIVCMAFYAFYHSAFDTGLFWRRRLWFFAMCSVCLGVMALPGCQYPWLYSGVALWALLDQPAVPHKI